MRTFRLYRLSPTGKILSGDWLHAVSDAAALTKAEALCEPGTVEIELWEGARQVARFRCDGGDRRHGPQA